jgi:hypothetical protein
VKKSTPAIFILLFSMNCYANTYRLHPGLPDFEGQHFDIDLKFNCPEGEMTCDDVDYDGINKKTGARLRLKGRVMFNSHNYNFQGYIFDNGGYSYVLNPDYSKGNVSEEVWNLKVFYKNKVIATDQGVMH